MIIYLYTKKSEKASNLLHSLQKVVPKGRIMRFESITGLSRKLREPKEGQVIAVLMATSREELIELNLLGNQFRDIKRILIVSDDSEETISLAHSMKPRFLSTRTDDFSEIVAVLHRILPENSGRTVKWI